MIKEKIEDFNLTKQDLIKAYHKHKFITEIKKLDWDNLDEDMYIKIMIFVILSTNNGYTFVNGKNIEYSVIDGDLVSKKYIPEIKEMKKNKSIIEPEYVFERIEYQKEVSVEGKKGLVTDWEEYVNGKTYYEYSEDSYERKNWRTIEYNWRNFIKF